MEQVNDCEATPALSGVRILIVEDEFLISAHLKALLTDAGAEIVYVCQTVETLLLWPKTRASQRPS